MVTKKKRSKHNLNPQSPPPSYYFVPPVNPGGFSPSVTLHTSNFTTAASITDNTEINALRQLMTDLTAANIWNKIDYLYPFSKTSLQASLYNFKDPTTGTLTAFSGPGSSTTHTPDGISVNNGFLDYGAYLSGPNATITWDDYHWAFHTNGGNPFQEGYNGMINSSGGIADYFGGASALHFDSNFSRMRNPSNTEDINLNIATTILVASAHAPTNASLAQVYRGATATLAAVAPMTLPTPTSYSGTLSIGGPSNGTTAHQYFSTRVYSFFSFGKGLTPTEAAALADAMADYATALGRPLGN